MRPTPETDAKAYTADMEDGPYECVDADFCRDMERQRDEWRDASPAETPLGMAALFETLKRERDEAILIANELRTQNGLSEFYAMKDQRDRLAAALRELHDAPWLALPRRAGDIIEQALSATEPQEPRFTISEIEYYLRGWSDADSQPAVESMIGNALAMLRDGENGIQARRKLNATADLPATVDSASRKDVIAG